MRCPPGQAPCTAPFSTPNRTADTGRALAIDGVPHPTRQAVVHNLYNEVTRKHEGRGAFVQNVGHQVRRRAAKNARQAEEQAEHRAKRRCRAHLHDVVELRDGKKGFEDYQIHDKASSADAQRVLPGSPRVRRRSIFGHTRAYTFCLIGRGRPRRCIVFRLNRTHCLPPHLLAENVHRVSFALTIPNAFSVSEGKRQRCTKTGICDTKREAA